jgi:hypothetical protein
MLHWLLISERVKFKIALLTFKARNLSAPPYLSDVLRPYDPGHRLLSSLALKLFAHTQGLSLANAHS